MFHKIVRFFDKLEDRIRETLSRFPVIYSIIGGVAIVVFWRGVWVIFDNIEIFNGISGGIITLVLSTVVMLGTGLFVSFFVGDRIILSGLKHEKKLEEKAIEEIEKENDKINLALSKINSIESHLAEIKEKIGLLK